MKQFLIKNKYTLLFWAILVIAFIVRFYNFDMRWGLGNDDSRDIMIAKEALRRHELPLIGSFSSAGPFVFGPIFYWFIMLSYFFVPWVFTIPWILTGLVGVTTVAILMWCGKKIAGNNFMLLLGLFAATSPQIVVRSLSLGQHTFIGLATACMILALLFFFEKKKILFAFLAGAAIGVGINFHYQALNLLIFLSVFFFVPKISWRLKFASVSVAGVGVLLALTPLIIWDSQQQFANFKNILDYFLVAQHRLYVPNSWRLFIFTYVPNYWSIVVGKYALLALITMFVAGITLLGALLKRKLSLKMLLLLVPFGLLLFLNRFYKGERSEGYLLYFLPFILLVTTYTLYLLFQRGRYVLVRQVFAGILAVLLIIGNVISIRTIHAYQSPVASMEKVIDTLVEKHPNQKFTVYDYKATFSTQDQALSALLFRRDLIAQDGMPVGFLCYVKCPKFTMIAPYGSLYLADLRKEKNVATNRALWVNVNPQNMYDDLIGWSKRHELTSTFSIQRYLTEKLHF
jgi:hypothetical protein